MKLLAFVDMHNSESALKKIKSKIARKKPDLVVCAGDFTIFEQGIEHMLKEFSKFNIRTLITPGNHETPESIREIAKKYKNIEVLHDKHIIIGDYVFIGYGCGGFALKDKHLDKRISDFKKMCNGKKVVFVAHAPPYKTKLDIVLDSYCGDKTVRKFIEKIKPIVAIVGHMHENAGLHDFIKDTKVINPGPFGEILEI